MNSEWSYSHGFGQSLYHVVLVPYRRKKVFMRDDIRKTAIDLFFQIADVHRFTVHELEVMENHVHLFISIRPSQSIAQVLQYLKGVSSRELRSAFPELKAYHKRRLWSSGKYYRPISDVSEETVRHYIRESQGKHHKNTKPKGWLPKPKYTTWTPRQRSLDDFVS